MFQLERDSWGKLILIDDGGQRHAGIMPVRGFPISDPHHFVSICDAAGHELVCIENVAEAVAPIAIEGWSGIAV